MKRFPFVSREISVSPRVVLVRDSARNSRQREPAKCSRERAREFASKEKEEEDVKAEDGKWEEEEKGNAEQEREHESAAKRRQKGRRKRADFKQPLHNASGRAASDGAPVVPWRARPFEIKSFPRWEAQLSPLSVILSRILSTRRDEAVARSLVRSFVRSLVHSFVRQERGMESATARHFRQVARFGF